MGKFSFNGVVTSVIAAVALIYVTSCVNSKYELSEENLDLKVTVFQEGVSLPLGSTDKITLESLYAQLDDETKEMLKEMNTDFKELVGYDTPAYTRWDTNPVYHNAPTFIVLFAEGESYMDGGIMCENIM